MKLKKTTVFFTIILLAFALLGIVLVQTYLLRHGVALETQIFHQNVNAALNSIVQKLETRETLRRVIRVSLTMQDSAGVGEKKLKIESFDSLKSPSELLWMQDQMVNPKVMVDSNKVFIQIATPQDVKVRILDSLGHEMQNIVPRKKTSGNQGIVLEDSILLRGSYHLNVKTDSVSYLIHLIDGRMDRMVKDAPYSRKRFALVNKVIDDMTVLKPKPILERVSPAVLDSTIQVTLAEKGIRTPCYFGVLSSHKDSLLFASVEIQNQQTLFQSKFRTTLFPNDIFQSNDELILYFPNQTSYLFSRVWLMAISSLLFFSIIIFCLAYVLKMLFKQKLFSRLLTDFINNMTHEFKTPISTISLASETLANPAVLSDETKMVKYGKIIRDESSRMRQQVEKILQMAELEEGEFELNQTDVDMHRLLDRAIKNFGLKIEKQNGAITTNLEAENPIVQGDKIHLENVLHNLLDNAVKYCKTEPAIEISTKNEGPFLQIYVRDNGIGLTPEQQKRVFDKYYRVPTGNIHDVKGFGIGLSYVKLIVKAHGGSISLSSQPGEGTTFVIELPKR